MTKKQAAARVRALEKNLVRKQRAVRKAEQEFHDAASELMHARIALRSFDLVGQGGSDAPGQYRGD